MTRKGATVAPLSGRYSLILLSLISAIDYCDSKVTCFQSPGKNAVGPTCEGDYCVYAELPGIDKSVRGCLSGDLLKSNIPDQCERGVLDNKDVCVCSKEGCNVNPSGIKTEKRKLLQCYDCSNKNCSKDTTCWGEYCVVIRQSNGKIVRGCSNPSLPLFERKGLGSCVTPSFPSHAEQKHWDEATLKTMTCACNDRQYCNGIDYSRSVLRASSSPSSNLKKCRVRAFANTKLGTHPAPSVPECTGEHCFTVVVELDGVTNNVSGCMSFYELDGKKERPQFEALKDRGCMTIHSETLRARACFDTDEPIELKDDEDDDENDDDEKSKLKSESTLEAGDEAKENEERQKPIKNKTPKERESPLDEESTNEKPISKVSQFIHADVDPDNPVLKPESEGNTAIVAVFVAIMVLIVIAGVIWKFELHKKIFHARYQTVAG